MILRLALAELKHRPARALFLLGGYALGVSVMVVLLAVGEAMLEQARDKELIGGGDVALVPAGVSAEMLKSGGVSSLFLGIDHARFLQRNLLESPRGREDFGIVAAAPILDGKQVEILAGGERFRALAAGEIPSRARAAGAAPALLAGEWEDSDADRRWVAPTPAERLREMDRFHRPTGAAVDSTWAEWHYFNVVLDRERWMYVTLMVGGEVGVPGRWGGRVLITLREPDGSHRSLTREVPGEAVRFDTASPELRLGERASVTLTDRGDYRLRADAGDVRMDLTVRPSPRRYFPPTELGGAELVSGYVAPALFARAEGRVCLPRCEAVAGAQAYHDHNWGVWRDVSWEWGAASGDSLSLLYGVVRGEGAATEGLFAYLVDERGVRGIFRPGPIEVTATRTARVDGATVRVPRSFAFADPRKGVRVTVEVEAAHVTDLNRAQRRYFVQMRGTAAVRENGRLVGRLPGFFETYVE